MAMNIGNAVMDVEVKLLDKRRANYVRFHHSPTRCQPISAILWNFAACRRNRVWDWALSLPSCPARALKIVTARQIVGHWPEY
jgi:hypothetical protein